MKKWNFAFFTILIILIVSISIYHFNNSLYGNDKKSIVKVIKSIKGYEDGSIEILEIKDFNDVRIVGFLYNNRPAYTEFYRSNIGNYKWRSIEVRQDETLSSFSPLLPNNIRPKLMYVSNYENKITQIQVDINGELIEQKFLPNKAKVTWVDFPKTDKTD
ncbi:hypothetical protein [Metabacillus fastidiosus]|uniref:hypothetical protein n=1 Tax=Metabacillus fastidiosus TaxID=1458 RepID=UPI002E1C293E|nr:hypothetical protein [Metabacillus fastidiosus]